jgi:RHS repeat-associated protein
LDDCRWRNCLIQSRHKHYLSAGGITFAIQTLREGTLNGKAPRTLNYLHHDHLGSTSAVTDETGTVIERMAYDPWGKRRFTNGTADTSDSIVPSSTDRGFTMHEHLDELGIIHMNGRIYDPYTGRFMSADPFIQAPGNLQSYNRYAYVMNNPLNMTDPSGYFSLRKAFRVAIAIYVAVQTGQWANSLYMSSTQVCTAYTMTTAGVIGGAVGGFAGAMVSSGGNFNAGMQGAFTGALFGAAGTVGNPNDNIRYAAHAAAGCVSAVAGGSKCGSGMTSALFGKYTTNMIGEGGSWIQGNLAKGVATTIAGGVGSVIAGGKFENGATTAAMGYLFNCGMHPGCWSRVAQGAQSVWARIQSFIGSPIGQTLTEIASGEVNGLSSSGTVRVGRWMSELEYKQMRDTGRVVESQLRVTNVAFPANSSAYAADTAGKLYVEFNVPRDALHFVDTSNGWAKIHGPSSPFATRLGVTQMPVASEIEVVNPLVQQIPW